MALAITEEHRALAESARSVLVDRGAGDAARAALDGAEELPELWKDVVSLGWLGLHLDERYGGQGYGLFEVAVVLEEMGRVPAPGPFLPNVIASAVLQAAGTEQQRERWLPGLAAGTLSAAVGLEGTVRLADGALSGDAGLVLGAQFADLLLLAVGDDLAVVEVGPALTLKSHTAVDPTRPVSAVTCTSAPVVDVLTGGRAAAQRLGRALAAAEAVGGMQACTERTVAYAKLREQFGRKIGSFQAVKHHCADMLVATELATAAAWDATRTTIDADEAELTAAVAAAAALPAFVRVAEQAIQLHGGIGFTWEHDAHLYLRRAAALLALFGPVETLYERVTELRAAGVRRRGTVELPPEAEQHRKRAREFLVEHERTAQGARRSLLARSGYLQPHWPAPFGLGAGPVEQLVIDEELGGIERPSLGLGEWVVPTLLQNGTPEQVERWIWPSLEGEIRWCQLFSEPGAGSDAAAVSTSARQVEGGWLVNGQKVWTSDARNCERGLATVRTDPTVGKHAGITAMVIDMKAKGVDVRPLREITGDSLFNEVFFDDVFVPDEDVVGAVNDGWRVARATLGNERISIGGSSSSTLAQALIPLAERYRPGDVGVRREVGALLVTELAQKLLNMRHAARAVAAADPGPEGSLSKLVGAEHAQHVADLGMRIAGAAVLAGEEPEIVHDFFFTRCLTIAGGTSEVLRNQIAERILGLPRE